MKKLFDKMIVTALTVMMTVVCVTFMTACGGGDDDPLDNPKPVSTDTERPTYFKPYTVWGSSRDQVSAWMTQFDGLVNVVRNGDDLCYDKQDSWGLDIMQVWYEFDDYGSLTRSAVWYDAGNEKNVAWLIAETERIYGVVFVRVASTLYKSEPKNGMTVKVNLIGVDECTISFERSV